MGIKGYYVKPNFFSEEPEKNHVTFYLTDGGRTSGNIFRIKEVYVSIDCDNHYAVVNVPKAYGNAPFIAEFNLDNPFQLKKLFKFFDEIKEWLGYRNCWRNVSTEGKCATFILIRENTCEIKVLAP